MSDKAKANQADSSHGKSSVSELKSLGSTSSITIPKSSPVRKVVAVAVVLLGLGGGGYVFSTSEMGKSFMGSSADDTEEVAKDDGDAPVSAPDDEGLPSKTGAETPQAATTLLPQGPNPPAAAQAAPAPVAEPVKAVEAPAPEKKGVVTKSSKHKKGKAVVSKKAKAKKTIAKHKGRKAKAVASKKAKAKKSAAPAQAAVAPAH